MHNITTAHGHRQYKHTTTHNLNKQLTATTHSKLQGSNPRRGRRNSLRNTYLRHLLTILTARAANGLLLLVLSWGTKAEPTSFFVVGHHNGLRRSCCNYSWNLT